MKAPSTGDPQFIAYFSAMKEAPSDETIERVYDTFIKDNTKGLEDERPSYVKTVTGAPMKEWSEVTLNQVYRAIMSYHKDYTKFHVKVPVSNIKVVGDFRPISPQVIKAYCAFLTIGHRHETDFNSLPLDMSMDITLYHMGSATELGVAEGSHRVLTARILGLDHVYCRVVGKKKRSEKGYALNKFERYTITKAANAMKQRSQSNQDVTAVLCQIMTAYLRHLNDQGTQDQWKQTLEALVP